MDLLNFFYLRGEGNFGDCINHVFFETLLQKKLNAITEKKQREVHHYITTGSILNLVSCNSIVYGSGFISETSDLGNGVLNTGSNKVVQRPLQIISVRGPDTRAKLIKMGVDCPQHYGDPLVLFPLICQPTIKIKHKYGVIPHYIDKQSLLLTTLLYHLGEDVKMIDILTPHLNYKRLIEEILSCEYIISSSLHGIIMGLIYKRKTIFVEFGNDVIGGTFKFYDFFHSLHIDYKVNNIYSKDLLKNVIPIDYNNLYHLVSDMIRIAPFIEPEWKPILINRYKTYLEL